MKSIYKALRPILFQMDPEQAHELVRTFVGSTGWLWQASGGALCYGGDDLNARIAGLTFSNPIGLAAGFDKNGHLVGVLRSLGFGFAEIGSVTARATSGNPKPRLFRLPDDKALINRLGLNGDGAEVVAERLTESNISLPVGLNIAKTNDPGITGDAAIEDILFSFSKVKDLPIGFVTINASCPNTTEGCLREKKELGIIFSEIRKQNQKGLPVFVKLSPDSSDQLIEDIVEDAVDCGLAGYVCGNTTTTRSGLVTDQKILTDIGQGGLSGRPLKKLAQDLCSRVNKLKKRDQAIIAVGGVSTADDAYEFIKRGAGALELYTAYVYEGPTVIKDICTGLSELLKRDGVTLEQAIGSGIS